MSRKGGRVGSPMRLVLSPEAAERWVRERQCEEESWRRRSGPVRTRKASPEELEEIRRGTRRPRADASSDEASVSTVPEVEP